MRVYQVNRLKPDYETKRITINKDGVDYDAYLLFHKNADNCKWTLYAGHGSEIVDDSMNLIKYRCCRNYQSGDERTNFMLLNGPSVGRSRGWPTSYQIGAGYEAALQFLEKEMGATHIITRGHCFGGGALSEAIRMHDFEKAQKERQNSGNPTINYLIISDRTFNHLSNIASDMAANFISRAQIVNHIVTLLVKSIFFLLGIELNGLKAAKKLENIGIKQIVIQHTENDGTISLQASLAETIKKSGMGKNKIILQSDDIQHIGNIDYLSGEGWFPNTQGGTGLPDQIETDLNNEIQNFLSTSSPNNPQQMPKFEDIPV